MNSKGKIQIKWVTEDGHEHLTEKAAEQHQFLIEAAKAATYPPKSIQSTVLVGNLKLLIEAGWTLQAPVREIRNGS